MQKAIWSGIETCIKFANFQRARFQDPQYDINHTVMEVEQGDDSNTLDNETAISAKRGRGRPRGSFKKKTISVTEKSQNARESKRVDYFSPEMVIRPKIKKRCGPKKIKIPGRPRKIPLTPEEEAERILRWTKKRRISKPLGRPRIHPLVDSKKGKRGRGRPRKYETIVSQNSRVTKNISVKVTQVGGDTPRKRGRPRGSFKLQASQTQHVSQNGNVTPRKRGRPPGSGAQLQVKQDMNGTPRKRGRPPGSGAQPQVKQDVNGTPRKRGRPPGSGTKLKVAKQVMDGNPKKRGRHPASGTKAKSQILLETNGSPRKRGRPPGSGKVKTVAEKTEHVLTNNTFSEGNPPRKRGRPKKTKAFSTDQAAEDDSKENEESSPKRSCNTFANENDGCYFLSAEGDPQ